MKYMLMFCDTLADFDQWRSLPEEVRNQGLEQVNQWFQRYGAKVTSTERLQPVSTATTVVFNGNGGATVTDGPFIEAKETIGGYALIDVTDLDEALEMAKTWPGHGPDGKVEVRPIWEM